MQSIVTKYLGPTNTRGSRIVATASGYDSGRTNLRLVVSYDDGAKDPHLDAAMQLATRLGWDHGEWIGGENPDRTGLIFVCNEPNFAPRFTVKAAEIAA